MPSGCVQMKRIRPVERQPMREWLLEHLDAEELPGLTWVDRQSGVFKIRWRHGSRHGWTKKDINVFEQWAKHTGRHYYGNERDEKRWKANFRCALNSLKTVKPVSKTLKGQNAFREYRIMDMLDTASDVKLANHSAPATTTRQKRNIKKEAAASEEETYMKPDAVAEDAPHSLSEEQPPDVVVIEPVTVPDININLPNFNKISPGLLPLFEYGKQHTIKNHYCGYTVTQIDGDQPSDSRTSYQLSHQISLDSDPASVDNNCGSVDNNCGSVDGNQTCVDSNQTCVDSNQTCVDGNPNSVNSQGYHYPDTPEDSLPTDTEQGDIEMLGECIEITTDQEVTEPWDNNSNIPDNESYPDHFPLTPPDEVVVSQEQTAGPWGNQNRVCVDKLPTFVSDCNFSINA